LAYDDELHPYGRYAQFRYGRRRRRIQGVWKQQWSIHDQRGAIDNTSGAAMTLDLKGGQAGQESSRSVVISPQSSNDLDFGTAPVELTATSKITVADNKLTISAPSAAAASA